MDLMTLAAKIQLDSSGFEKGVRRAEGMGQQLTGKISAMTVAVGQLAADIMRKGIQGIEGIIGGAIDGYADYQQLIGGVETLFKDSSDKVSKYAKQSFKTTGLSANDYMETVTGFAASLLQGLEGDTDQAAEYANMAITDMADNANKMGTDMSAIQNAYQGFAKQNYTMLDNLKLGYGGTREEMVRLINDSGILSHEIEDLDGITFDQIVLAIHEVQTEMGITGTTAKEAAETISGSKASLKAAWEDMLSAVGGEGGQDRLNETLENFKSAFSTYMENFIPTLAQTIVNSGSLVTAIAEGISDLPTTLLSELAEGGLEAGTEMVGGVSKITSWLIESISNMFRNATKDPSQIADFGKAIGEFLGTAISDIVANAPDIIGGIFTVGVTLAGSLIEGLFAGLFGTDGLGETMGKADRQMAEDIENATESHLKSDAILNYMNELITKYGEAATETAEWKNAQDDLQQYLPDAGTAFENYANNISGAVIALQKLNDEQYKYAMEEAKRRALETKQEAVINAQAALWKAQSDIQIREQERSTAINEIEKYFRGKGVDLNLRDLSAEQIKTAVEMDFANVTGGAGNAEYNEMKPIMDAWVKTIGDSDDNLVTLKASVEGLEKELQTAQTSYLTSSAAIDDLTGSASGAAQALQAIRTPSVTYDSGSYANWYYGGQSYAGNATGMDYVPYDGYRAELHRGEAIITASENKKRAEGGADMAGLEKRIENAIRAGMANARVEAYFDGQRVTDEVNRNNMNQVKGRRYAG